jgi:hydroxymethylpyrimidine/phosphomethylpyrimidine kinase
MGEKVTKKPASSVLPSRPVVLVFAGLDPSGGAGIQADIEAIGATGSHALPVVTALTVQDNDKVWAVHPVDVSIWRHQAQVLLEKMPVNAIKIGIIGNRSNAEALADFIIRLKKKQPEILIVLDTVLGSGHGDLLAVGRAEHVITPLLPLATLITPNLPEAARLAPIAKTVPEQAAHLLSIGSRHVLIKGGHSDDKNEVENRWFTGSNEKSWKWKRLDGDFHGSGCTLASLAAGFLAQGLDMEKALEKAQAACQIMLKTSFSIAQGQRIPNRHSVKP